MNSVTLTPEPRSVAQSKVAEALDAGAFLVVALPFALFHGRAVADGIIVVLDILFLLRSDRAWLRSRHVQLGAAFWLWLVACSVLNGSTHSAIQAAATMRFFLLVPALEYWILAKASVRRALLVGLAVVTLWLVSQTWEQYLTGTSLLGYPRFVDGALTGPFAKPRDGGVFLALVFPVILPAALWLTGRGRVLLGGAMLAAALATMVLIGQRMPTVLMAFGLCVAALRVRTLRRPATAVLLAGGMLVAATPLISPPTYAKLVLRFSDQLGHFRSSDYGRLFERALAMVQARPWTGFGFDGFRDHCDDPEFGGLCNIHPHNYWLDVATSSGLPGLALFALLVALWLIRLGRGLNGAPLRTGLFVAAVVAFWPIASTSSLWVAETAGWVFLTVGWGLALTAERSSLDSSARPDPVPA